QPRFGEGADPLLLCRRRHQVLGVLQAVARSDFANHDFAHAGILDPATRRSIAERAKPHAPAPAAKSSITHSDASQPPKRDAIQAMASGPKNCPTFEACWTIPVPVAMCWGERACTGRPEKMEAGISALQKENTSTSTKRASPGS